MANAGKHMGPGAQGKRSGIGALTELPEGILEKNMVLSNRDKSRHSDERGLDSATAQTEQYRDHAKIIGTFGIWRTGLQRPPAQKSRNSLAARRWSPIFLTRLVG
jgi:hypothetical protein